MPSIYGHESEYVKDKRLSFRIHELVIFLAVLVLVYLYAKLFQHTEPKSLTTTLVIVAVFLGAVKLFSRRFYKEDRGYRRTRRGLKGEDDIIHELQKLPDEYSVFRNVSLKKGSDTDCIVVGPSGVFTIETKSHQGRVDFNGQELTLNYSPFKEKDILKQTMHEALDLHDFLLERLKRETFVTPILVFSNQYASVHFGMKPIHGVHVIQKSWLLELITKTNGRVENMGDIVEVLKN